MIKTILIAFVYFLIGIGICANYKHKKKDDPGFIAFVLICWPVILGTTLLLFVLALIVLGIDHLIKKWRE